MTELDISNSEKLNLAVARGDKTEIWCVDRTGIGSDVVISYMFENNRVEVDPSVNLIFKDALLGDCNGDGVLDRQDRMYLARALAGWENYEIPGTAVADLNVDGVVDRQDRMYLARNLAGWEGYDIQ